MTAIELDRGQIGLDLTGAISYFGSPSAKERIATDLAEHRIDLTVRKQILWESETATDAEALTVGEGEPSQSSESSLSTA